MRLCSAFDEDHKVVCDDEVGHEGPHRATVIWGEDEDAEGEENPPE